MAWVKTIIPLSSEIETEEARLIAEELLNYIVDRTKAGKGQDGKPFPGYSPEYKKSLDFKIAGKSPGKVDLTLTGEMLDSLKVLIAQRGKIVIGYDQGDPINGKAEGNILGSYGGAPNPGKARDFMAVSGKEIRKVIDSLDAQPLATQKSISNQSKIAADRMVSNMLFSLDGEGA
jgi:hypothetical protein